jgi:hypothetical protein
MNGKELREGGGAVLELGGKKYNLVMDMNAFCDIEDKYETVDAGMSALSSGKIKDLRFLLWVLMRHDDDEITERQAAKYITLQNMSEILPVITRAMTTSIPETDPNE